MLRTIIIDDEPLAGQLLGAYVEKTPSLSLLGVFTSAHEAFAKIQQEGADLVFLDIQMPQLSGMEFARLLPPETFVVFTTAFERYAIEGYKVNAVDYLLKPISYDEFLQAVAKAETRLNILNKASGTTTPDASASGKYIIVKSDYRLRQIPKDKILYVEGLKDYVRIYVEGEDRSVITLLNMKTLEEALGADQFMRVHRSFLVNLEKITSIERNLLHVAGREIPVSDSYRPALNAYVASHLL